MRTDLRAAQFQQTRAVLEAVAQLIDLAAQYRRAASGPEGEPNRANEALLALESARQEQVKVVDCHANPKGGEL